MENIKEVELSKLLPFPDHPFRVLEDESMWEMAESVSYCLVAAITAAIFALIPFIGGASKPMLSKNF